MTSATVEQRLQDDELDLTGWSPVEEDIVSFLKRRGSRRRSRSWPRGKAAVDAYTGRLVGVFYGQPHRRAVAAPVA